jgi:hypothetical protein
MEDITAVALERPFLVNDGWRRLATQDHIAAGRFEGASVGFAESQFVSGLQSVVLTRMVPIAVNHACWVWGG